MYLYNFFFVSGPFNVPITSYMKLTNPSDKKVLFKIKTTAPKKYCVRPNSGVLEPKNFIEIASRCYCIILYQSYNGYFLNFHNIPLFYCVNVCLFLVCLQPFIFDPAEKNKHKFMVQTVFAPEGEVNLDALVCSILLILCSN